MTLTVVGYDDSSYMSPDPSGWFSEVVTVLADKPRMSTAAGAVYVRTAHGAALELVFEEPSTDGRGVTYNAYYEHGMGGEWPVAVVVGKLDLGTLTNHEWTAVGGETEDPVYTNPQPRA